MARRLYGSFQNRLEENRQFVDKIEVGTGMTEYGYTDRQAYEVIAVEDQKHVTVRRYDHRHVGDGCMDNSWELVSNENNPERKMVKRGQYWYTEVTITADLLDSDDIQTKLFLAYNNVDPDKLRAKGEIKKYHRANVTFGKANYYFDYEF